MLDQCDICRGSRYVRLPVWPTLAVAIQQDTSPISMGESSRSYPCPQCANIVSDDHVKALDYNMMVDTLYMADREYMPSMRRHAAHGMVDRLVEDGFITFRLSKEERDPGRKVLRAELGVVSPAHVATMESRIAERQDEVARSVAEEAIMQIYNWGSAYGHTGLSKHEAELSVKSALARVLAARRKEAKDA